MSFLAQSFRRPTAAKASQPGEKTWTPLSSIEHPHRTARIVQKHLGPAKLCSSGPEQDVYRPVLQPIPRRRTADVPSRNLTQGLAGGDFRERDSRIRIAPIEDPKDREAVHAASFATGTVYSHPSERVRRREYSTALREEANPEAQQDESVSGSGKDAVALPQLSWRPLVQREGGRAITEIPSNWRASTASSTGRRVGDVKAWGSEVLADTLPHIDLHSIASAE
ncbi:hypothetical protein LTR12_008675 [Friedmanniomyces endolithicus]|nr:hypothetical protein LTR12_008675 [Friedmanniomyces endolithicus]